MILGHSRNFIAEANVTWNPSDKGANIVLSNGNLDATGGGGVWNAVRATVGKTAGKFYWEIFLVTESTGEANLVGAMNGSASLTTYVGNSASGGGAQGNGASRNYFNGWWLGTNPTHPAWAANDVIMFAVDYAAGKIWIGRNGSWLASGDPAAGSNAWGTGLGGTVYAAASEIGTNGKARLRTKLADFSYSPPSGFSSYATP